MATSVSPPAGRAIALFVPQHVTRSLTRPSTIDDDEHMLRRGSALSATNALAVLTTIALIGLVLLAPMLLDLATKAMSGDWALLSDVGQTYGAASAILSSFALIGIVLSTVIGLRQARIGQQEAARSMQFELMKMQLDDPTLATSLPPDAGEGDRLLWRRAIYRNMTFMYLRSSYLTEDISDVALGLQMGIIFQNAEARAWWQKVRSDYATGNRRRPERKFVEIVEQQWQAAQDLAMPANSEATHKTNEPAPSPEEVTMPAEKSI